MTRRETAPLAAAVGLAAVTADRLRRLPSLVVELPPAAIRAAREAGLAARERYDQLALHGRDVLAARVSSAPDQAAAGLDQAAALAARAAGRMADLAGDRVPGVAPVADEVADRVAGAAQEVAEVAGRAADRVDGLGPTGDELAARAADARLERMEREPDGSGTTRAEERTPIGRTEPVELSDDVLEEVAQLPSGAELGTSELPLPNFDHLTVPQLRDRLRTLTLVELVQLRDYEVAHGNRAPVLTLLDNRIGKLTEQPPG